LQEFIALLCRMKKTKIHQENGKVKYVYDYPENRAIAAHLTTEDKIFIAMRTGYTTSYIRYWCVGKRKNENIRDLAKYVASINQSKQRKLNSKLEPTN